MYTVTIYASRMPIPIQFAVHTWIVTEHDGKKDRFDVFGFKENRGERNGYLYKNFNAATEGCPMFALGKYRIFEKKFVWKTELLYETTGRDGSDAEKIYSLLHGDLTKLPFINTYHFLRGPNSNSFTQWVLNYAIPGKYQLPWRAYGRGWSKKIKQLL